MATPTVVTLPRDGPLSSCSIAGVRALAPRPSAPPALRRAGIDLFAAMGDQMPAFQRLMDAAAPGELDRLAARFPNLRDYAVLLTSISAAIRDGAIEVPR